MGLTLHVIFLRKVGLSRLWSAIDMGTAIFFWHYRKMITCALVTELFGLTGLNLHSHMQPFHRSNSDVRYAQARTIGTLNVANSGARLQIFTLN